MFIRYSDSITQNMDNLTPSLLPIFRSRQQAELLALLLGDPDLEVSVSDLAARLSVPYASVHREVERAESSGVLRSRKIGNTRLVSAQTESPYFDGLSSVVTRAFGVPAVLARALNGVTNIRAAYVFGSWASQYMGGAAERPVQDIDVLILGAPDRDVVYDCIEPLSERLGRPVQVTIRGAEWLDEGDGSFHDSVIRRPMVRVPLSEGE